ncbi:MAG: glutamate-1-semialdehyde 2,1-aminomutase [Planctomycetota bacterium]|nr:glutamate-1-semialdehyde 2,1-aminomutase [Planctomycetota bacterium]
MTNSFERSAALFESARRALPGGVSSPVRAFGAVGGTPLFIESACGSRFTDADGNQFLDFVGSWGPLILGHANPEVLAAVQAASTRGLTYGAPHAAEVELAERIAGCYPGVERVRFTSSGTEATMSAIRLARGVTGRSRLVKFDGCYHGHSDGLLVAAGSGAVTLGQPSSSGVPAEIAALTSVLPLDDSDALRDFMAREGREIAAVIIEPVPANNGLLLQRGEFLETLRQVTAESGALLIFDEVISGFRIGMGGAAELYDIRPDLVTFGKIIGGGMPVGAFAGPASYFEHLAPLGGVYQAGTLSGNPVAMAAGLATLEILVRDQLHSKLERLGQRLEAGVCNSIGSHPVRFVRQGSIFWFHFGEGEPPRAATGVSSAAAEPYGRFFRALLTQGVYLAPSAYEVGFLSAAHTEEDIDLAVHAFRNAFDSAF